MVRALIPRESCMWRLSSLALRFLSGQLRFIREAGYEVTVISFPGEDLACVADRDRVQAIAGPMERKISPLRDLVSLWRLWQVMRRDRAFRSILGETSEFEDTTDQICVSAP